jgi:aminoglycoside 6'-N-acetyltransferase
MNHSLHKVTLAPFVPKRDLATIESWIKYPHIVQGWGDSEETRERIDRHLPADSAMINADAIPVGYICWQEPTKQELAEAGLESLPHGLVDIDIMIGDPNYLGQGVGPQALSLLLSQLSADGVKIVGLATTVSNERALKAYEKVGFIRYRRFIEKGVDHYYLIKTINSAA